MTIGKRTRLDDAVQHAANGERVRVRRNDVKGVRRRRVQAAKTGAKPIPWEKANRKLRFVISSRNLFFCDPTFGVPVAGGCHWQWQETQILGESTKRSAENGSSPPL